MSIKIGATVKLKNGNTGKVIGQLESREYMVKSSKKGEVIYCQKKDIVNVER
ncbi:hypothetical protein AB8U03_15485 [Clostridium sp. Mt-5]|uniref:DUF2187 domain-containing protein n=1 Tax=Clostridium moutaii TaxID=3240932 RepID=A0ABV4BV61_9CLOT